MFSLLNIETAQAEVVTALLDGEYKWRGDRLIVMLEGVKPFELTVEGIRQGAALMEARMGAAKWERVEIVEPDSTLMLACAVAPRHYPVARSILTRL